jgi:hypothetical protein
MCPPKVLKLVLILHSIIILQNPLIAKVIVVDINGSGMYTSIKEGIAAADSGDTVFVLKGVYPENNIKMKNGITLQGTEDGVCTLVSNKTSTQDDFRSNTIILIDSIKSCIISRFRIRSKIIGLYVNNSKAILNEMTIDSCSTGVFAENHADLKLANSIIMNNGPTGIGLVDSSKLEMISCIISNVLGAGIEIVRGSTADIANTVIYRSGLHALRAAYESSCRITNAIIWDNLYGISFMSEKDSIVVSYSNVQIDRYGKIWRVPDTGNIDTDPFFVDSQNSDFHLQSNSPCIDMGNPEFSFNDPDGSRNDMGAFGGPFGNWIITNVKNSHELFTLPNYLLLYQNSPNPFNTTTRIDFLLEKNSIVSLAIYNRLGQIVQTLVNGRLDKGRHSVVWDAAGLPSGIYFCRIESETYSGVIKLLMIK